jgi:hypothetical protein
MSECSWREFKGLIGLCLAAAAPAPALAQAGPPYLSNDRGVQGSRNWEINLAVSPTFARSSAIVQAPSIDLNYGVGENVQLTVEVPYVVASGGGTPQASGWGNAFPGFKWRFLNQGEAGWQAAVFPQLQTGLASAAQVRGFGDAGPRYLLPVEVEKRVGILDVDFEAGEYLPVHGPHEHIFGLVAGRSLNERLELDAELYDDRADAGLPRQTTLDVGGRYLLTPGLIALFMVGHTLGLDQAGPPAFIGYFGIQILLSDNGRHLNTNPP